MPAPANPITPSGHQALKARYDHLLGTECPAIVEIVSWAAAMAIAARMVITSMAASGCARSTASSRIWRGG